MDYLTVCIIWFYFSLLKIKLFELKSLIDENGRRNPVNVSRDGGDPLNGLMRAFRKPSFTARHLLDVKFSNEDGIDTGGPTKECLRMSFKQMQKLPIFVGPEGSKFICMKYGEW